MNKAIMLAAGFKKEVELYEHGFCPFCEQKVDLLGFKNRQSAKEYVISGLCQTCQDKQFNQKENDNGED